MTNTFNPEHEASAMMTVDRIGHELPSHPMHIHSAGIVDDETASLLISKGYLVQSKGNGINYVTII